MNIREISRTKNLTHSGFTLVEVMLALSLTAMLLGLLSTGVFVVADDWNRSTDVFDQSLDESLIVLQIDRALHGAFPHSFTNRETLSRKVYFKGDNNALSWVTTVSPQRTPSLTAWKLSFTENAGVFIKTVPAFTDDPSLRLEEAESVLVLPDHEVSFSYLYEDSDDSLVWTEEWEGEERLGLPLAVYAKLTDVNDFEENPKEIVARIRNNTHRSIRPDTNDFIAL